MQAYRIVLLLILAAGIAVGIPTTMAYTDPLLEGDNYWGDNNNLVTWQDVFMNSEMVVGDDGSIFFTDTTSQQTTDNLDGIQSVYNDFYDPMMSDWFSMDYDLLFTLNTNVENWQEPDMDAVYDGILRDSWGLM